MCVDNNTQHVDAELKRTHTHTHCWGTSGWRGGGRLGQVSHCRHAPSPHLSFSMDQLTRAHLCWPVLHVSVLLLHTLSSPILWVPISFMLKWNENLKMNSPLLWYHWLQTSHNHPLLQHLTANHRNHYLLCVCAVCVFITDPGFHETSSGVPALVWG